MNAEPPEPGAPAVVTPEGYFVWDRPDEHRSGLATAAAWAVSHSAMLFAVRQAIAGFGRSGGSEYQQSYARMIERGLSDDEWAPIETFYRDLLVLGHEQGFSVFVVVMPVNDIVARSNPAAHPYAVQVRQRLETLGLGYLDGFQVWQDADLGARHFLPQGADAHLDSEGYEVISDGLVDRWFTAPPLTPLLAAAAIVVTMEGASRDETL